MVNKEQMNDFVEQLIEQIKVQMRADYGVEVDPIQHITHKTNVELHAITVKFPDSNISPTIYAEDMYPHYLNGTSIEKIAESSARELARAHKESIELPKLTLEEAKKHIRLVVVNAKLNEQMLTDTPHYELCSGEISAYPRWYVTPEASFRVTNDIAGTMGLTPDEVLQIGQKNTNSQQFSAVPLGQMIADITGDPLIGEILPQDGPQMVVLTNESRMQGANALLSEDALNKAYEMIGGPMVICPSSVHELICLPVTEGMSPNEFRDLISTINSEQVAVEERLSDEVLMYDGHKLSLVRDSFTIESPVVECPAIEAHSMRLAM